ncbi:hypothetical protein NZD89_13620 [Alicyclobacillus fastidiosus]|uniref:Uncharacterized protein n=1 Tax=Alicyclobacillus fastidiosus TaxID=392011 RepID=A0ABY6ZN71_9BACL|nr:hypothetical protein [Alicyclobacillus fastidiosus]WAH44329.1 hypothetical protein NZD89_13620 [Alicyclobacillus fastidiosus]
MKVRTLCAVAITSVLLVGCGQSEDDAKRQAAIASQALPLSIADKPAGIQLPRWQNTVTPTFTFATRTGKSSFTLQTRSGTDTS